MMNSITHARTKWPSMERFCSPELSGDKRKPTLLTWLLAQTIQNKGRGLYRELGVDGFGGVEDGEGSTTGDCGIDCGGGESAFTLSVWWFERASTVKGIGVVGVSDELESAGTCWRGSTRARRGSRVLRGSIRYDIKIWITRNSELVFLLNYWILYEGKKRSLSSISNTFSLHLDLSE